MVLVIQKYKCIKKFEIQCKMQSTKVTYAVGQPDVITGRGVIASMGGAKQWEMGQCVLTGD